MERRRITTLSIGAAFLFSAVSALSQASDTTPPRPEHPATAAQVQEFYQAAGMQKLLQQLIKQMMDGMRLTANNSVPESVWQQMQADFDKYDFEAAIAPAYQRYVSQEDMAAAIAYIKSDGARRMKATEPYIQQMIGEVSRKAGQEIGEKAARDHMDEIIALQKKNDAAAAARVNGGSTQAPAIVLPPAAKTH